MLRGSEVAPLPKKLQKAPRNSKVCERVENVAFLPRGRAYNAENASTSTLVAYGFIFAIYMRGRGLLTKT